jgi:pimeloyl-ACP methyl ester carboxylesterase
MNKYPPPSDISFTSFHGLRIAAKRWGYVPDGGVLPSEDAAEDRNYIKILALHGWLDSQYSVFCRSRDALILCLILSPSDAATFDVVAPLVLQNIAAANPAIRVTIVCLDLPGHGLSDHRTKDSDYADWRYALDVEACVQQLRWKRFSLLAHSMVGLVGCGVP